MCIPVIDIKNQLLKTTLLFQTLLTHSLTKGFISGAKLRPNIWMLLILVCRMQEAVVAQTMHEVPPSKQKKNEISNSSCPADRQGGRAGGRATLQLNFRQPAGEQRACEGHKYN